MIDLFGTQRMLALSWKQPYATAMLLGKIETRVWATKYRGPLLICVSKTGYSLRFVREISGEEQYGKLVNQLFITPYAHTLDLFGMAIAVGNLVDCREMKPEDEDKAFVRYRAPWVEERTGKDGRVRKIKQTLFCHIYENVRPIIPFPWKGCQGWAEVTDELKNTIEYLPL